MIVQCAYCGKDVKKKPSAVKRYPISYCNKSCTIKHRLETTDLREKATEAIREWGDSVRAFHKCSWCGKEFRRECGKSRQRKTCSDECLKAVSSQSDEWQSTLQFIAYHAATFAYVKSPDWIKAIQRCRQSIIARANAQANSDPWNAVIEAALWSCRKRISARVGGTTRRPAKTWESCIKKCISQANNIEKNSVPPGWERKLDTLRSNLNRRYK